MDKSALNKIVESLQKSKLADGKKLLVSNKVKPDVLGGVLVELGDRSIDLTVSSKLAKLNKLVTGKKGVCCSLLPMPRHARISSPKISPRSPATPAGKVATGRICRQAFNLKE